MQSPFMKRIIFTISGMCLAGSSLYAQQDQLHFADMSAAPSAVLLWPVKLSGPAAVVGVQFDLVYAPGQVASGSARAGTGGLSLLAAAREIAPGRTRVAVSSLKNEALVKDAFLELPLSLPSTAPAGGPFYTIEHIILTLADGTKVPAGVQSGPLTEWRKRHFTPEELLEGSLTGDGADPDGDGASNLVEYAVGGDPRRALPWDAASLPLHRLDREPRCRFHWRQWACSGGRLRRRSTRRHRLVQGLWRRPPRRRRRRERTSW